MRLRINLTKRDPRDVVTIAHRGGVVDPGAHEDSRLALFGAIERGYDMVEIDVASTADHHPILVHNAWRSVEMRNGAPVWEITFHDKTLAEAKRIKHPLSGETVLTLAGALELCRGHLGIMLDFKHAVHDPLFYERVNEAIETYGFKGKTLVYAPENPYARASLGDTASYAISAGELEPLAARWEISPLYYGYGLPDLHAGASVSRDMSLRFFSEEDVTRFHEYGLGVIIAINTYRYFQMYSDAAKTHAERAAHDIARYRAAGVDGIQLDSAYDISIFSS